MAVGVFDSGLGGLTVLDALTKRLPEVPFVYFGDNAHAPYGVRTADDIFNLTWAENCGISLSMFANCTDTTRWTLVAVTGIVAAAVGIWMTREQAKGDVIALAMILGGALGNIVDRVRMGYVLDFLDLHFGTFRPFYVFNVADAAISIGVVILLIRALVPRPSASTEIEDHA